MEAATLSILVVGKTAVGKSALVNSLFGKKVATECAGPDSGTNTVHKYTHDLHFEHSARKKDIRITIWDSPGYKDCEEEEGDQDDYFEQLKSVEEDSSFDLLLFCTPLNERRWRKDDEKAMAAINRAFGPSIWNNALIVLTQANLIEDSNGKLTKEAYEQKVAQWTDKIDMMIKSLGVQTKVLTVPTGKISEKSLPNTDDWFSEFWTKAFYSLSADKQFTLALLEFDKQSRVRVLKPEDDGWFPSIDRSKAETGLKVLGVGATVAVSFLFSILRSR